MSEKEIRNIPEYRKMLADAEKSETIGKKEKKKELHWFVKKLCNETNLPPNHPKIKEMVLKGLEDSRKVDFNDDSNPLYELIFDEKKLKNGNFYID